VTAAAPRIAVISAPSGSIRGTTVAFFRPEAEPFRGVFLNLLQLSRNDLLWE
jgi:hypothetical protein